MECLNCLIPLLLFAFPLANNLKYQYIKLCLVLLSGLKLSWFLQAEFQHQDDDDKIYQHIQYPFVSGFGPDWLPGVFLTPNLNKDLATYHNMLCWKQSINTGD